MRDNIFSFSNSTNPNQGNCSVFLPGWGFDGRVTELADHPHPWLAPDTPLDPAATADTLANFLDQQKIESIILAGWSMGAYLAIDFALLYPERIKALYLLAIRQSWPAQELDQIRAELYDNPVKFMKTFYRKCFLGHKPSYRKFTDSLEESYLTNLDPVALEAGLVYLQNFPLAAKTNKLAKLDRPTYLLHGAKDIIAPAAEMPIIPGTVSQLIKTAGHPVFLDESCPLDFHKKKETIRLKFSRSAATYDAHASLQKEVAARLATLLPEKPPAAILETGCGTGGYTCLLKKHYPAARITAIDFAENMLGQARQKLINEPTVAFQCADAEIFLKEKRESFDLVTSNATMHWFDNLENTAGLIADSLTDNGALICSIFGPETMGEMQAALKEIHGKEVVMPSSFFPSHKELQKIFNSLFTKTEINEWQLVRQYPNLIDLLRNISKTGTAGWHPGQPLLTRHHLKELENWFIKTYDHYQISYQIFMVSCHKSR
ncbi:MAG: alpha/beta fold hydrolase [Thermodesulfobacteriota bacterium]